MVCPALLTRMSSSRPAAQLLPRRGHEPLPVGTHRDVAGGPRDAREAAVGAPAAQALLQVGVAAGAGVDAHPEPRELLHDGAPDPFASSGDERRLAGQASPLLPAPSAGRHS